MRKIPKQYENPIDDLLIDLSDKVQPYFYKLGFTPNMITTLSLIICLFSIYLFKQGSYLISGILFFVAYFFDCLDGHMARTYNMHSKFGDYYDHISDILKLILLFYTMYKVNSETLIKTVPYFIFLYTTLAIHMSCQELYHNNKKHDKKSESLNLLKHICPASNNNVDSVIQITKFFGCGTANLFTMFVIIFYNYI